MPNHAVAIVGMACIFPGAPNVQSFWQNIIAKVDAVSDPPPETGANRVFNPASTENDRIYTKRGGYLGNTIQFDALNYGIMPNSIDGGEPEHYVALQVAHNALADAGYSTKLFDRDRAAVILGRSTFLNRGNVTALQHGQIIEQTLDILRNLHPEYAEEQLDAIRRQLKSSLPPFNAETASGLVSNITCGRIANRLNLRGPNYTVDAACASSLIAVDAGVRELQSGRCDLALVGGVSVSTSPIVSMVFCQLDALSHRGQIRPFDRNADGTLLGEGVGIVVLKREEDARRDGDRIYALLKGVGISSDGYGRAVLAPQVEGELLALQRAYQTAQIDPHSVELIEAHGTGTLVGDLTEIQALSLLFGSRQGQIPSCAIGTVKSMISHAIPAAGIAGLIKASLALYHKILPPTLHCEEPNPAFELEKTPFYINTEARPWIHAASEPRRSGVSAFGFGGINTHAVLEENVADPEDNSLLQDWATEILILQSESRSSLIQNAEHVQAYLLQNQQVSLKDLSYTINCLSSPGNYRLALVVSSIEDAQQKLARSLKRLQDSTCTRIKDRSGIFFFENPLGREGKVVFLFPGEGSQYTNMLSELCMHFPEVRQCFERADQVFLQNGGDLLPSHVLFPPPLTPDIAGDKLWDMDMAVASIFASEQAIFGLLSRLGIQPDIVVGHSIGELGALMASGAVALADQSQLVEHGLRLNRLFNELKATIPQACLMAVNTFDDAMIKAVVEESQGALEITMDNCPQQVVLCGADDAIEAARDKLHQQGAVCSLLPFDRAYHSPRFEPVSRMLAPFFASLHLNTPTTTIYTCMTASPFPEDAASIRELLSSQWANPVRFRETIEAIYAAGGRIFVEVGPKANLTGFVDNILHERPYLTAASDMSQRSGITQLQYLLGLLAAHGISMNLAHLYARRNPQPIDLQHTAANPIKSSTEMTLLLNLPYLQLNGRELFLEPQHSTHDANPSPVTADLPVVRQPMHTNPMPTRKSQNGISISSRLMSQYFQTMEQFLDSQHQIMTQYMAKRSHHDLAPMPTSAAQSDDMRQGALGLTILSLTSGEELVATCDLNLEEHLYLRDHTIGGNISSFNDHLSGLSVNPLAVNLELMAEASSMLIPGKSVVGIRNVRAYRWVIVEEQPRSLLLVAQLKSRIGNEVYVRIFENSASAAPLSERKDVIAEGTMILADKFPPAPQDKLPALRQTKPYPYKPEDYYRKEVMYHGPSFQTVAEVEQCGPEGADALIKLPAKTDFFRSANPEHMHLDPALLDAAGQTTGFWAAGSLDRGFATFPIGFDSLDFYAPSASRTNRLRSQARITALDSLRIQSNIDFVTLEGQVIARIENWFDARFHFPREYIRFVLSPGSIVLSRPWAAPLISLSGSSEMLCFRLDGLPFDGVETGLWLQASAWLVLNQRERLVWNRLNFPEKRRREWLLGRIAAKDAVRTLLQRDYQLELCPADIEIITDEYGKPLVEDTLLRKLGCSLSLSISHAEGAAVALVGYSDGRRQVGIDIEPLQNYRPELRASILSAPEEKMFAASGASPQDEWVLRLWCAKEAVAKALGRGIGWNAANLLVQQFVPQDGRVMLTLGGELAQQIPQWVNQDITAYTGVDEGFVFASAWL